MWNEEKVSQALKKLCESGFAPRFSSLPWLQRIAGNESQEMSRCLAVYIKTHEAQDCR
jgi:hypothetical protein